MLDASWLVSVTFQYLHIAFLYTSRFGSRISPPVSGWTANRKKEAKGTLNLCKFQIYLVRTIQNFSHYEWGSRSTRELNAGIDLRI